MEPRQRARGVNSAPKSMRNRTAAAASGTSAPPTPTADSTLGARLAAASRQAQGLNPTVKDTAVLAALRELCAAPRPASRTVAGARESPAP
jgi:hypothetical protein